MKSGTRKSRTTMGIGVIAALAAAAAAAVTGAACSSASSPGPAAAPVQAAQPLPAPEVHSVEALLAKLPAAESHPLDLTGAMTLAAYPLSCLDHPQAQAGGAPAGAPAPSAPSAAATSAGRGSAAGGRGTAPGAAGAPGRGAAPAGPREAYLWQPAGPTRLLSNYDKQRSFYGCYDWHSAVNSTWTLVMLLKTYPDFPLGNLIREKLNDHLGKRNLAGELAFFQNSKAFERPYGQAWLLKLYGELLTWNDPDARKWAANMAPLAHFFSQNLTSYFTKLPTPVRQGVHPNTAFDMDLLLPYAAVAHDDKLHAAVVATAQRFYAQDEDCPTGYEPEGVSFLSPCLVEGALMAHILDRGAFTAWYNIFMPAVYARAFRPLLSPFDASKMTPDQMAGQSHLIGLAFSRAAAMLTIASALPPNDPRVPVLRRLAAIHAAQGYKTLDKAGYLETHWIASYALLYQLAVPSSPAGRAVASN